MKFQVEMRKKLLFICNIYIFFEMSGCQVVSDGMHADQ